MQWLWVLGAWLVLAPVLLAGLWWWRTPTAGAVVVPMPYERWAGLPAAERDSYLRHPCWARRCRCARYGLPWWDDGDVTIFAVGGVHEPDRCFPHRESVR